MSFLAKIDKVVSGAVEEHNAWKGKKSYKREEELMIGFDAFGVDKWMTNRGPFHKTRHCKLIHYETGKVFVGSSKKNYGEAQGKATNIAKQWLNQRK